MSGIRHRWSVNHNYLAGITAGNWWRLLRENRFAVDPVYWHRAAFISVASLMNSWNPARENRQFNGSIDAVEIKSPPLFILGHWRSGTTLLHYLLAQDTEQFAFANTYQTVNPETFLTTEAVYSRRFARLVPKTRPMDNMSLSFQTPQEDEFAPCLTTLQSPYLGISFSRHESDYDKYLSFDDVAPEEVKAWKTSFLRFLKKLTLKYDKPLVLKSPPHTARIRLLLEMFPDARFVHIHRNPYEVFQSFLHYFDTAMWFTYLQCPDTDAIIDRILRLYNSLFDAFFAQKNLIPEGQFHELRFDDLERNPVKEMEVLYNHLSLPGFAEFRPKLENYLQSLSGYLKNRFPELNQELQKKIAQNWKRSFDTWGYPV